MLKEQAPTFFRARRISDGKFLGNRKWGETHSSVGKFYTSFAKAKAAIKASYCKLEEHEIVEYDVVEKRVMHL